MLKTEHFQLYHLGICNCGCGQSIPLRGVKGKFNRFAKNHNNAHFIERFAAKGPNHPRWKERYMDNGYVFIHVPDHPHSRKGWVQEHRLVMEKHVGRYLTRIEVVHHINHNRADNRIENLMLLANEKEHKRIHHEEIMKDRKCAECGSTTTYYRENRNSYEWSWYKSKIYCNKCIQRIHKRDKLLQQQIFNTFINIQ